LPIEATLAHYLWMGTKSRESIKVLSGIPRSAPPKLVRKDRLARIAWNQRMVGFKGPKPSPALGDALNAGYLHLEVRCLGCDSHQTVALNIVRRPKATPIHELERCMRCKDCSQVRGYLPFVDEIQRALTAFPAKGLTLFGRNDGKPMTSAGLSDFMKGSDSGG
jgi:hypothetical protein